MSTKIRLADFKALRDSDSNLYHALIAGTKAEPGGEVVVIDDPKGQAFRIAWTKWLERNPDKVLSTDQPQDELWKATQRDAQIAATKAHILRHSDEAIQRYKEYWVKERGLLPSQKNTDAIMEQVEAIQKRSPNAIMSAQLLDLAIEYANVAGTLKWKVAEPVVPTPEPPPPIFIDDPESPTGKSEQLPLSTQPRRSHTKAQLRDWDARQRAEHVKQVRAANNTVAADFANKQPALEVV